MIIPNFIEELVKFGIPVTLQKGGSFFIEGFYKSGSITIEKEVEGWVAVSRYDTRDEITCLYDVVWLNNWWWQRSKDRSNAWLQPAEEWIPLLELCEFIKTKTVTIYE